MQLLQLCVADTHTHRSIPIRPQVGCGASDYIALYPVLRVQQLWRAGIALEHKYIRRINAVIIV